MGVLAKAISLGVLLTIAVTGHGYGAMELADEAKCLGGVGMNYLIVFVGQTYYFDEASKSCQANKPNSKTSGPNVFDTMKECETTCSSLIKDCLGSIGNFVSNNSLGTTYYYHQASQTCKAFIPGIKTAGPNAFDSKADCERICYDLLSPCLQRKGGSDRRYYENLASYHFDKDTKACTANPKNTKYTGPNYFETKADCETTCADLISPCLKDQGEGQDILLPNLPSYYFNQETKACRPNPVGTRFNGPNNFLNKDDCETTCSNLLSPCMAKRGGNLMRIFKGAATYSFNQETNACTANPRDTRYNGRNNFKSLAACKRKCSAFIVDSSASGEE